MERSARTHCRLAGSLCRSLGMARCPASRTASTLARRRLHRPRFPGLVRSRASASGRRRGSRARQPGEGKSSAADQACASCPEEHEPPPDRRPPAGNRDRRIDRHTARRRMTRLLDFDITLDDAPIAPPEGVKQPADLGLSRFRRDSRRSILSPRATANTTRTVFDQPRGSAMVWHGTYHERRRACSTTSGTTAASITARTGA